VQAERDSRNDAADDEAPPVMPAQLVKLWTGQFISTVLDRYREQIGKFSAQENIEQIEFDHKQLLIAYSPEPKVKEAFDSHDRKTMLNQSWDCVQRQFTRLRSFNGGLVTAFANTTSVERDFSFLKWEKDAHRTSLTSLALEGIMQSKQFQLLSTLSSTNLNTGLYPPQMPQLAAK
jgi:hypothetical protein